VPASKRIPAEDEFFDRWCLEHPEAIPTRQFRFTDDTKHTFDFAWQDAGVAVEIDGFGRHMTYAGFRADCRKGNTALVLGWRVLHFVPADIREEWAETRGFLELALNLKPAGEIA